MPDFGAAVAPRLCLFGFWEEFSAVGPLLGCWSPNRALFPSRGQQTSSSRQCLLCLMRTRAGTLRTTSTSSVKIPTRWNVTTPSFMNQTSWAVSPVTTFVHQFFLPCLKDGCACRQRHGLEFTRHPDIWGRSYWGILEQPSYDQRPKAFSS